MYKNQKILVFYENKGLNYLKKCNDCVIMNVNGPML